VSEQLNRVRASYMCCVVFAFCGIWSHGAPSSVEFVGATLVVIRIVFTPRVV
jgi:hypothetical protein